MLMAGARRFMVVEELRKHARWCGKGCRQAARAGKTNPAPTAPSLTPGALPVGWAGGAVFSVQLATICTCFVLLPSYLQ